MVTVLVCATGIDRQCCVIAFDLHTDVRIQRKKFKMTHLYFLSSGAGVLYDMTLEKHENE